MHSRPGLSAGALAASVLIAASVAVVRPAFAQDGNVALGANVESLLAAARRLSPTLQAAALGTRAAGARADAAGALPDPTFMINDDEVDRTGGPRINKTYYLFGQTFPLWGKRDLQHQAALHALEAVRGQERTTRDELDERVKVAFAQYYAVSRGIAINADIVTARAADDCGGDRSLQLGRGIAGRRHSGECRRNAYRNRSRSGLRVIAARRSRASTRFWRVRPRLTWPLRKLCGRSRPPCRLSQLWLSGHEQATRCCTRCKPRFNRPTHSASWRAKRGIPMSRSPPDRSSAPADRCLRHAVVLDPPAARAEECGRAGGRRQSRCVAAAAGCHHGADRR